MTQKIVYKTVQISKIRAVFETFCENELFTLLTKNSIIESHQKGFSLAYLSKCKHQIT